MAHQHEQSTQFYNILLSENINITSILWDTLDSTPLKTRPDLLKHFFQPLHQSKNIKQLNENLQNTVQRLYALDIFKKIKLEILKDELTGDYSYMSDPLPTTLKFLLEEKKRINLELSMKSGIDKDSGKNLNINIIRRNVFGGGEKLSGRFNYEFERAMKTFEITYLQPLFKLSDSSNFVWSAFTNNIDETTYSSYKEHGLGTRFLFSHKNHELYYQLEWSDVQINKNATEFLLREAGHTIKSSVGHHWKLDTRDNALLPQKGYFLGLNTEIAGFGGNVKFIKSRFHSQYNIPILKEIEDRISVNFDFKGGFILPLQGNTRIGDRFFLGGIGPSHTFRGFNTKGMGPRLKKDSYGGDIFYTGSMHLNIPLSDPSPNFEVFNHLFLQYGGIEMWKDSKSKTLKELVQNSRLSCGIGFVIKGPGVRFEAHYVNPIFSIDKDKKSELQFGLNFEI